MRFYGRTDSLMILGIIFATCFGCKLFPLKQKLETPDEPQRTVIVKGDLSRRLNGRLVQTADRLRSGKPNPLTLQLTFARSNKDFLLNREYFENFGALSNALKQILKDREERGIFEEGTNDVYEIITLPAYQKTIDEYNSKNIYVEDLEKLVDDLRLAGFNRLELDTNENNQMPEFSQTTSTIKTPDASRPNSAAEPPSSRENPKTVSGGVLNGKAINLEQPAYPAAARAVRATGAVNVAVTVNETGEVVSANAVSGHPLLRSAAVSAARKAKFSPTLLSGQAVQVTGVIVYNFKPE